MNPKSKIYMVIRVLTGLMAIVWGANYFAQWFAIPEMAAPAMALLGAMFEAGYIFPIFAVVQILVGIAFVTGYYVPRASLLLAPFTVNIVIFHLMLDAATIAGGLVYFVLNLYIGLVNWKVFKPLFQAK